MEWREMKKISQQRDHYGLMEISDAREIPRNLQSWSIAVVERVPELTFPCNQNGEYPNSHHRNFSSNWWSRCWDHIQKPGCAIGVQSKGGKKVYMSRWSHDHYRDTYKAPKCRNSRTIGQQLGSLQGTELGSLYVGDNFVAFFVGPLSVKPGSITNAWSGFLKPTPNGGMSFLNLMLLGRCLVLPQRNVQGLVDSPWEALPFLRSGWCKLGGGGWNRRMEERKNCSWYIKLIKKINRKNYQI